MPTIFLFPADQIKIQNIINNYYPDKKGSMLYLGKNILNCKKIERILRDRYTLLELQGQLQEVAHSNRQDYIDFIGHLGANSKNDWYWLTSVSEKNPYISDVFLNFCYLKIAILYAERSTSDLIIVCESSGLLSSIFQNFQKQPGREIKKWDESSNLIYTLIGAKIQKILSNVLYCIRMIVRIVLSRLFAYRNIKFRKDWSQAEQVLIYSWVDHRSFQNPDYSDIYCGILGSTLKKNNISMKYLAHVLPTIGYGNAMKEILKRDEEVLLFEELLTFSDVIRSLRISKESFASIQDMPKYNNLIVQDIIIEQLNRDTLDNRAKLAYLMFKACNRIPDLISISSFIYPFENHIWERMLCKGVRECNPGIFLTGYAHSVVNYMYLCYSMSSYEKETLPLPDRIMVNGKRQEEVLRGSGFSGKDIVNAGAVRYADSITTELNNTHYDNDSRIILVAASAGVSATLELIEKVLTAFHDKTEYNIIIKPHPITPISDLMNNFQELPPHITINHSAIHGLLDSTELLIYSDTTVCIEALARGIPVLHIKSDLIIDINPLEGYECIPSVSQPEEIQKTCMDLLHPSQEKKIMYQNIAKDFFEPIHDKFWTYFIREKVG